MKLNRATIPKDSDSVSVLMMMTHQVNQYCTRDISSSCSFIEVHVDTLQLKVALSVVLH